MGRDSDESAPPITLPASWTRSPEASMGHLPGNPAEEPDSARSGGHLPGKSPWADAGSTSPPPWQALGALGGRAREGFPGGSLRRQRGQGVGGPILAFAERRGCGQDSVPPDGPAAGGGIARALGPTTGGGIARAPSVFQRHLPHSGQVSGLFPIGYLCKTTRD